MNPNSNSDNAPDLSVLNNSTFNQQDDAKQLPKIDWNMTRVAAYFLSQRNAAEPQLVLPIAAGFGAKQWDVLYASVRAEITKRRPGLHMPKRREELNNRVITQILTKMIPTLAIQVARRANVAVSALTVQAIRVFTGPRAGLGIGAYSNLVTEEYCRLYEVSQLYPKHFAAGRDAALAEMKAMREAQLPETNAADAAQFAHYNMLDIAKLDDTATPASEGELLLNKLNDRQPARGMNTPIIQIDEAGYFDREEQAEAPAGKVMSAEEREAFLLQAKVSLQELDQMYPPILDTNVTPENTALADKVRERALNHPGAEVLIEAADKLAGEGGPALFIGTDSVLNKHIASSVPDLDTTASINWTDAALNRHITSGTFDTDAAVKAHQEWDAIESQSDRDNLTPDAFDGQSR